MDVATPLAVIAATSVAVLAHRRGLQRRRTYAVDSVLANPCHASLRQLSPAQFAACVFELLRREGLAPRPAVRSNRNLLLARAADGVTLVHCRFWTDALVGHNQVSELCTRMRRFGAARGMLITAGNVADNLARSAAPLNIQLVDGNGFLKRIIALEQASAGVRPGTAR